jgi:DNA mismatch endonuclease Vsr
MDVMTHTQRYRAMAHNRGRTTPERALASALWHIGIRYYTHEGYQSATGKRLPGNPDVVLSRKMVAIFVDGCFWHGCPQCRKHNGLRGEFWIGKIAANRKRDRRVTTELENSGWTVIRIPEHDLRTKAALAKTVVAIAEFIRATTSKKTRVA